MFSEVKKMIKRKFEDILKGLKETVNGYDWFVDFNTVLKNLNKIKNELSQLNNLIGSNDFLNDFELIFSSNPNIATALPILIAMRANQIKVLDGTILTFDFDKNKNSAKDYVELLEKTGIRILMENKVISNLYDYVLGVEAGINTNARKNRTGKQMESLVGSFLKKDLTGVKVYSQITGKQIEALTGNSSLVNLGIVTKNNKDKKFDFAFEKNGKLYVIECNFYSSQGSKLAATVGQYIELNDKIKKAKDVEFVWVTDGMGWLSSKNDLNNAYQQIGLLFTIEDLENGILKTI
jgi:type II restriction enzyme